MDPTAALDFLLGVGRFIVMLGVLIFVHELGHFAVVAKWCGIYVATFSFGMGRRLFGFKWGDTDYRVSLLPIGGYVKMIGQSDMPENPEEGEEPDPDEAACPDHMRFDVKPVWMRLAVSAAGPAMSLAFGVVVYWVMFVAGVPLPRGMSETRVGYVLPDSPADKAGIRAGETVLSIGGTAPKDWEDLRLAIIGSGSNPVEMRLATEDGTERTVTVTPRIAEGESLASIGINYHEEFEVAKLFPDMPAQEAGIEAGDVIVGIREPDGTPQPANQLQQLVREHAGETLTFILNREDTRVEIPVSPTRVVSIDGIEVAEATVIAAGGSTWDDIPPRDIPAPGDTLVAVNGVPITDGDPQVLRDALAGAEDKRVPVEFRSEAGLLREARTWTVMLPTRQLGLIGIEYSSDVTIHRYGALAALPKAVEKFNTTVRQTIQTLGYFVMGRVSPKEIAGPLGIGMMSEQVVDYGWIPYLQLVALITINLGIINLLPVPVLDGGNIVIFALEGIRRRPLNEKVLYYAQHAGLVFLLFLLAFATFNDLRRLIAGFIG